MSRHMIDVDEQHKRKIRISIWVLVMVTIAIYAGFIYLATLAGSGGVE